jgi:hypothetical protein
MLHAADDRRSSGVLMHARTGVLCADSLCILDTFRKSLCVGRHRHRQAHAALQLCMLLIFWFGGADDLCTYTAGIYILFAVCFLYLVVLASACNAT